MGRAPPAAPSEPPFLAIPSPAALGGFPLACFSFREGKGFPLCLLLLASPCSARPYVDGAAQGPFAASLLTLTLGAAFTTAFFCSAVQITKRPLLR